MSASSADTAAWTHIEALSDDSCFFNIPLGFTFDGFGANTSTVSVSSNGVLFFGQNCSTAFVNVGLPANISIDPALFFFWDDLRDFGSGEFIRHATMGSAPHRVFSMHFRNRLFASVCGTAAITAMISVHEDSNLVNVSYEQIDNCVQMRGSAATFGIQSANGVESVPVSLNVPMLDHTANRQFMSFRPQ